MTTEPLDDIMSGQGADAPLSDNANNSNGSNENRDERGRFAASQQEQDPGSQQQDDPNGGQAGRPPEGFVPIKAFDARLAKQAEIFQRRMEDQQRMFMQQLSAFAPQPKQETKQPPHFFDDPDAAFDARLRAVVDPLERGQRGIVENFSRMMASDKHGEESVNAALAEITQRVDQNPQGMRATYERIMRSPHPYGELVKWHKEQSALKTYGDDPEAFINAEVERRLAEASGQQHDGGQRQTRTNTAQAQQMPSSFANARSNGPRSTPAFSGPRSLSDIMGGR